MGEQDRKQEEQNDGDLANALQKKHAAMLHRLAINEEARLQKFAELRAGLSASGNPNESTNGFLKDFANRCKELDEVLSSCQARVPSENEDRSLKCDLDNIAIKLSDLEQFVAENAYFLPPYEVRASQSAITSLREKLESVNAQLVPKKRFSFKSKASKDKKALEDGNTKSIKAMVGQAESLVPGDKVENASPNFSNATISPWLIEDLKDAVIVRDITGQEDAEVIIRNLMGCTVYVRGICRAMHVHKLKGCRVYAGPITSSALIEEIEECMLMLASHQIRIHHAKKSDMYLRVRSHPIVEFTSEVRFAPYHFSYQDSEDDLQKTGLEEDTGLWAHVDDFRWLRATASPNWAILPVEERVPPVDGSSISSE